MQFQVWFVNDLGDEFEDPDTQFVEAHSWLHALQIAEVKATERKKFLSGIDRLE